MVEMETLVPRSPPSAASNNTVTQYRSPVVIGPSSRWASLVTGAVLLLLMCQDSRGCSWLPITLRHGPRSCTPKPGPSIEIKPRASEVSGIAPFGKDIQIVMRRTATATCRGTRAREQLNACADKGRHGHLQRALHSRPRKKLPPTTLPYLSSTSRRRRGARGSPDVARPAMHPRIERLRCVVVQRRRAS